VTLFGQMGTATELMQSMQRQAALAVLQAGAERERNSRCGRVCDIACFEPRLAELVHERVE